VLMTLCGQVLQSSIVIMADIPALTLAVMSALALGQYSRSSGGKGWLALAAALLALATITRWLYLILAAPWGIVVLLMWGRRGGSRTAPTETRFASSGLESNSYATSSVLSKVWPDALIGLIAAGIVFLPQIAYSRTNPNPTLNHAWVEGWSPLNAFRQEFDNIDGHFFYDQINAVYYAQTFYGVYYLSPVFTPFLLVGLWTLLKRRQTRQMVLLGGWALLPYLFLAGIPYQNIRFPLIVVPAVAILAGYGLETALRWVMGPSLMNRLAGWRVPIGRAVLALVLAVGLWQMANAGNWLVNNFIRNQQRDKAIATWVNERVPAGATLYTFGLTLTLKHYTPLVVYELYNETPDSLDSRWQRGQEDYVLVNVLNIETQWVGLEPQIALHWLRDMRGLEKIAQDGNYSLFIVKG